MHMSTRARKEHIHTLRGGKRGVKKSAGPELEAERRRKRATLTELEAQADDGQRCPAHHHQEQEAVASQHLDMRLVLEPGRSAIHAPAHPSCLETERERRTFMFHNYFRIILHALLDV